MSVESLGQIIRTAGVIQTAFRHRLPSSLNRGRPSLHIVGLRQNANVTCLPFATR